MLVSLLEELLLLMLGLNFFQAHSVFSDLTLVSTGKLLDLSLFFSDLFDALLDKLKVHVLVESRHVDIIILFSQFLQRK